MSRRKSVPTYRLHAASGRAIVTVYDADGRRHGVLLPGAFESMESRAAYKRILLKLAANEGTWTEEKRKPTPAAAELTVNELAAKYLLEHAATYYVDERTKQPTSEVSAIKEAVRPMVEMFGFISVAEFDSLKLEAVQVAMATGSWLPDEEKTRREKNKRPLGLARTTINRHIDRIKRLFRWGCKKKLVSAESIVNLETVESLRKGRTPARETEAVTPVDVQDVDATLPFMPPCPGDIVRLLLLSGARVGELCRLRGCELDRTGPTWVYSPGSHKTRRLGHVRNIVFGPKAQLILRKYLKADPDALLFSPAEQDAIMKAEARAKRKTRVQPSQHDRRKARPKRKPGPEYDPRAINHAIGRACKRAGISPWHTHQLRHSAALLILREHGVEAARSVLGHKTLNMTLHYSGIDLERAKEVAAKIG